ncbi:MAG: hypothetical protein KME35_13670 [Aphanocapsa sp. GSE-SYN-MK-11-07L]|nr:hypothetical protein [Aphanocapsa sp. GSE-SYN-MK-11-07L]
MAERSDRGIIHPITQVLARLSRPEQLRVLNTHPLFTGKCPCCGTSVPLSKFPPISWDCHQCGWLDEQASIAS